MATSAPMPISSPLLLPPPDPDEPELEGPSYPPEP